MFSLLRSDCTKVLLCAEQRHMNKNAMKEGVIKGIKGIRECAVRLTRMCSFGLGTSKLLNAVSSSLWQSIQKLVT